MIFIPIILSFAGLEFLFIQEDARLPGNSARMPLRYKIQQTPETLDMPTDDQARRGVTISAGVMDPDQQNEVRLILPNEAGIYIHGTQVVLSSQ